MHRNILLDSIFMKSGTPSRSKSSYENTTDLIFFQMTFLRGVLSRSHFLGHCTLDHIKSTTT